MSKILIDGNCDADDETCVTVALQLFGSLVNNSITQQEQEYEEVDDDRLAQVFDV